MMRVSQLLKPNVVDTTVFNQLPPKHKTIFIVHASMILPLNLAKYSTYSTYLVLVNWTNSTLVSVWFLK